jgi:hypothetical protein
LYPGAALTQHEPISHTLYRHIRPVLTHLRISALVRKIAPPYLREQVARWFGLEGYPQAAQPPKAAPSAQPPRKFAFVFICQHGEIEVEATLLAISLKRFLRCEYELIAVLPEPPEIWGTPHPATLELLRSLGVRLYPVVNPIDPSFPYGNKLPCFSVKTDADKLFYLDSDILLIRDFYDEPRFDIALSAKPTDVKRDVDIRGEWPEIYALAGLQPPVRRRPSTASKYFGFPQFNGGVICVDTGVKLGETWEHYIRLVRANDRFTPERVWSDQIGLALAIQKLGVEVDHLDERYNYPLHHKRLDSGSPPYFVHYHYPALIGQEPALHALFHEFVAQFPQLREIVAGTPKWQALLADKPPASSGIRRRLRHNHTPESPELIVTGIPHSGTSALCQRLQNYSNCVVVDGTDVIRAHLLSDAFVPWGIGMYYREARSRIFEGASGMSGPRGDKLPRVDNRRFVLGTDNPVGILPHLHRLRRVLPEARVIICVRNPFETVASWKHHGSPYSTGDLPVDSPGHPCDPWLPEPYRARLETVGVETWLAQKRAMLWHYFAELVLNEAPNALIIRSQDMAAEPESVIASVLSGCDAGRPRQRLYRPEAPRAFPLDVEDIRAIRSICSQSAAELGLDLPSIY